MTVALSPANNPMVPSWAERERLLIKAIFVRDFRGLKLPIETRQLVTRSFYIHPTFPIWLKSPKVIRSFFLIRCLFLGIEGGFYP